MLETAGVSQAMAEKEDAAQNLEKHSQLQDLVSVDEREVPLERVKVHLRQFTLDDERIPALPFKGEADARAESSQSDAEESRRDERLMWREREEREVER